MPVLLEPISITTSTFTLTRHHLAGGEIFLNRAAGIAITLPAPDAGLSAKVIIGTSPTTDCTISTYGGADIMVVSVNELETDTTEDGPYDNDADVFTFKANVALIGDFVEISCDGTKWYLQGQTNADGAVTTGTT